VTPTLPELAEDTEIYLPPLPGVETVACAGFTYVARERHATVVRVRDVDIEWVRRESARRGHDRVEWWVGWSAPADTVELLMRAGLVPDEVPMLTGMTCTREPPAAPQVDVARIETLDELLEALEVDWEVWRLDEEERAKRRASQRARFEAKRGLVHHWCARVSGRVVGFARAIDLVDGVALMGGAVLPAARGRGVYRALVCARWEHAAARRTPLLVVQAGAMSAPVLSGLGFEPHGEIQLLVDRL
jgi:GNAT superfamily N-acetyltransferase